MASLTVDLKAPNGVAWEQPTGLFINNEFVTSLQPTNVITSIDPATEKEIAREREREMAKSNSHLK